MNPSRSPSSEPLPAQRCGLCRHRVAAPSPAIDASAARMAAMGYARCTQLPLWRFTAARAICTLTPSRFSPEKPVPAIP